jgi:NAD-dependent histone deacetylase SIR2
VAKDIYPSTKHFSPTHAFIRLLQDKGKLLTNFTQNIDNLEEAAGIDDDKLIQCHGSWRRATCQKCGHNVPGSEIEAALKEGQVARCKECARHMEDHSAGMKRKRSHSAKPNKKRKSGFEDSSDDEGQYDVEEPGVMKPDITFFGEGLPKTFHRRLLEHDKDLVDLCIVIGTSLKVSPVADIPDFLPAHIPQIYISRDPVRHVQFDIELLGDCDEIVTELCRRAGWDLRHEMIRDGTALTAARDGECGWRWGMTAEAGGIIDAKEIDEGTLGHGKSLSPKADRKRDIQFGDDEKVG